MEESGSSSVSDTGLDIGKRVHRRLPDGSSGEPPIYSFAVVHTQAFRQLESEQGCPPGKLVTVNAPIGYGKSVLLSELCGCYERNGGSVHWLSLDERDISVEHLVAHLESRFCSSRIHGQPLQLMHPDDQPLEIRVERLLEQMAGTVDPTTLFVDNLNHCIDETLPHLLDSLIFRTPSWFHIVLSSTGSLPFNQSRAKLEGLLRQVGPGELSFAEPEIRQLLGGELCARLSPASIRGIQMQTEGWASAIRLMQIVLATADCPEEGLASFSGADADLADLLNRQLMGDLDPDFRRFLLMLAPLRTFNVDLAREATGETNAGLYIERLWKRNIFLIPLDRNRQEFRFHTLFRGFLLGEAALKVSPEVRGQVLARAAGWYERAECWGDAIDCALEANALAMASTILERVAPIFVRDRGDLQRYVQWVEKLQPAEMTGLETDYWYVWALVFHCRYELARRKIGRLLSRLASGSFASNPPQVVDSMRRRIEVIRITIDVYTDRLGEARRNAGQWLLERSTGQTPEADDPFNVATVACVAGIHDVAVCRLEDARRAIRIARSSIAQSGSNYGEGWVAVIEALIAVRGGEYVGAYQDLLGALSKTKAALGEYSSIYSSLALMAGKCAVEMGNDEEAARFVGLGLRQAQSHGVIDTVAFGFDAAVKLWSADAEEVSSLSELKEIAAAYPPRLSLILSVFIVQRLIRLGRLDEAEQELRCSGLTLAPHDESDWQAEHGYGLQQLINAAQIDLLIARGKLKQAAVLVERESKAARIDGRQARLVELALDEAAIALCSHNPANAKRYVVRAVELAARRRYIRPFRDRSELLGALVNETRSRDWHFAIEEERRFFGEICSTLPVGHVIESQEFDPHAIFLADTPTARELELLMLIEGGLPNQQIADRLNLTVATVKWHLYNLYIKLGVKNRAGALARARALNLLAR